MSRCLLCSPPTPGSDSRMGAGRHRRSRRAKVCGSLGDYRVVAVLDDVFGYE